MRHEGEKGDKWRKDGTRFVGNSESAAILTAVQINIKRLEHQIQIESDEEKLANVQHTLELLREKEQQCFDNAIGIFSMPQHWKYFIERG